MLAVDWRLDGQNGAVGAVVKRWYPIGLGILLLAGALFRMSYLIEHGVDERYFGGLWVGFIDAIRDNSYALPSSIDHVTATGSPFAYPPLSFYISLILSDLTGLDSLYFVNVLPGVISVIALLAFYWLSSEFTSNKLLRLLVFSAFSFLLSAYHEQQFPSGLAESLGTLALILYAKCLLHLNRNGGRRNLAITGIAGAVTILASPGSAIGMFLTTGAVWITVPGLRADRRQALLIFGAVIGIAMFLSSWFWLTTILRHGPDIFFATFSDRAGEGNVLFSFFESFARNIFEFDIGGFEILGGIALIGLLELVRRRQFLVPLWLVMLLTVPQESTWLVSIPGAIAVGFGIWSIVTVLGGTFSQLPPLFVKASVTGAAVGLLMVLPVIEFFDSDVNVLSNAETELIETAKSRSDEGDLFLIVSSDDLRTDNFLEWFSFLGERTVLNQRWGAEFTLRSRELDSINEVLGNCESVTCVSETYLLNEGDPDVRRFVLVHPGIPVDSAQHDVVYKNTAGTIVALP